MYFRVQIRDGASIDTDDPDLAQIAQDIRDGLPVCVPDARMTADMQMEILSKLEDLDVKPSTLIQMCREVPPPSPLPRYLVTLPTPP